MAHTKFHASDPAAGLPVQPDDVSFSGISWFVVILTVTTLFCAGVVWVMFRVIDNRVAAADAPRSPVARPTGELPPGPNLLTDEPSGLKTFRESEQNALTSYGWIDRNAGTVRIPIDRAKDLLIQKGLPSR
jgi:hypothetical protein